MRYSVLCLAVGSAIAASNVSAQSSDVEVIEVKGTYFNDYQVDTAKGALRTDTSLLETAQSVFVISDTVIDEQLATTLGEVLNNDASLTAGSKQRNRETFNLRGFGLSSSNGYLRDGHQHWSHYQQPIETLEQVEIIKGPSSILYGQSGPGGLVNMVTKKPTAHTLVNLGVDFDHLGSTRATLDLGGALTHAEDVRYRTVLVKQDVNFNREYVDGGARTRDRFLGSIVLDYDINEHSFVRVHYDRTNDEAGLDTGAWLDNDGQVIGSDKTIRDFSWAFTDITVENKGIDLTHVLAENWQITVGYNEQDFSRQRFESAPRKPDDYQLGKSYDSRPYDRFDDWQFTTAFVDVTGEFELGGIDHQVLIGANSLDYYYGQLRVKAESVAFVEGSEQPLRPDISYATDDSLYTSEFDYYGIYVQDLMTINEHWQISLGGRYDKQNKEGADNESFLPKGGVLYHPSDNGTVYFSYSEGFEPQRSDRLDNKEDENHNMKLDAVTSQQYEVGTKWQLADDRLLVTAAAFDISKTGMLISVRSDSAEYQTVTTQAGEQRHKGVEFTAQGAVNDRLFVMGSLMNLSAEYVQDKKYQGNTPIDAPQWSASLWSRYEFSDVFAINAGAFYQGERFANYENTITKAAYTRIDAGATYKLGLKHADVNVRFNIENLFDKNYLAGGGVNNVTVGEETTFRLALHAAF
ncbi:TonB-dependent receptor [Pseudoalteromonas sp. MMG013]|uniref:TonB-dependent siderophore receptor n=1 Tax=Pseudoalteromonas sp. MMG013 TaxID=2822687 RepID=UPI001B364075|nr:TonB-dependent receptor [Pseudoalteromonas sp. MMG013]MBQ4860758.1 TonB-dependent receptor [Pseudoalteromonas sp. MMG013]